MVVALLKLKTIHWWLLLNLCTLIISNATTLDDKTCDGKWITHDQISSINLHVLGLNKSFTEYKSMPDVLSQMCAAENLMHNCYYHGITNRTDAIMKRSWLSNDSNCHDFHPKIFLERMRNRNLFLIGDSTMLQTWAYLMCSLLSVPTQSKVNNTAEIEWLHYAGSSSQVKDIYNDITCPFGAAHCLLSGSGNVTFTHYNTTISYSSLRNYDRQDLQKQITLLQIKPIDLVLFNIGLHFNDEGLYYSVIGDFVADYKDSNITPITPKLFFLETLPQHFTKMTEPINGYFYKWEAAEYCNPLLDEEYAYRHDWRNRHAEEFLSPVSWLVSFFLCVTCMLCVTLIIIVLLIKLLTGCFVHS